MQLKFNLFEDMEREALSTDVRDKQCSVCEEGFPETDEYSYPVNVYHCMSGTPNPHFRN